MNQSSDRSAEVVPRTLDHEMRLIQEAIALVASGGSPRVIVAGVRFGEALFDPAARIALAAGVRLVPLWRTDEAGADIAVERIND